MPLLPKPVEGTAMNLVFCLPVLFILGLVTMAVPLAFVWACDRI
jgi:hypothetical protein